MITSWCVAVMGVNEHCERLKNNIERSFYCQINLRILNQIGIGTSCYNNSMCNPYESAKDQNQETDRRTPATQINNTNHLLQLFPLLTDYEISICGLLSLKLSFEEIASITGKTSNSLRVTFHRLLKKTNFTSGKELLRKLESIS